MSELKDCYRRLETIGKSFVQKNANSNPMEGRVIALAKASETPEGYELSKRIMALERAAVIRKQYAPLLKGIPEYEGLDNEEDPLEEHNEKRQCRDWWGNPSQCGEGE